jgi:hypothetical protein
MRWLLLAVLVAPACRIPDGCVPRDTRCLHNRSQVCDADRRWNDLLDCDRVSAQSGAPFTCGPVSEADVVGHTCVKRTP